MSENVQNKTISKIYEPVFRYVQNNYLFSSYTNFGKSRTVSLAVVLHEIDMYTMLLATRMEKSATH